MAVQERHAAAASKAETVQPTSHVGTNGFPAPTKSRSELKGEADQPRLSPLQRRARHFITSFLPNFWWWATVILSVPFAAYAMIYVLAYEPAIREISPAKQDGLPDTGTYSQGIIDHMLLWQAHSLLALVYLVTAPLQFIDRVRLTRVPFHRASGYAFLASGAILAVTGVVMSPHSEMAPGFVVTSAILAPAWLFSAGNALWSIKQKRMQAHREWMIRTAAIGYSVVYVRPVAPLMHLLLGTTNAEASVTAMWICMLLSFAGSQLYIEMRYHGYGGVIPTNRR
ncbi:hypothetical protein KFL_002310170 [Klebsormidium nitens]|uniref:DUF2306 domain-containing protein n=1 Tax=Klebsormidium nitens TaxID=105231 RepID=A0A1Y1I897_KLENI|nr:hypothetical protein KFL_002310170 [Klebsormidium nitens]|eukprot:GAQ85361.1 hypothetical protein KFL_002310170 [Klebsormidium nitens]